MNPVTAIKWAAGVVIAMLLFFGGRSCGVASGNDALRDCTQEKASAVHAGQQMADALEASTKAAQSGAEEAARRMALANSLVENARAERAVYERKLAQIGKEMEQGMRDPDCRAQLERTSCIALH